VLDDTTAPYRSHDLRLRLAGSIVDVYGSEISIAEYRVVEIVETTTPIARSIPIII
jgi:hypothetical protein